MDTYLLVSLGTSQFDTVLSRDRSRDVVQMTSIVTILKEQWKLKSQLHEFEWLEHYCL